MVPCRPPAGKPSRIVLPPPAPAARTMNPGRFWFSVPSPYTTHDPIEGRPARTLPVFIINTDGP